ncbi:MAG: cell division protein ZapA [Methylococcaceae bacterium]|jgi:cell division protein ZapA|nr:cell division protein ZapA [Methylococcaceae bacterium]
MRESPPPIKVQILGKEYPVSCPADEQHELLLAARYLDEKMREIRDIGRIIGTERIAVMAALNIAHELLQLRQRRGD